MSDMMKAIGIPDHEPGQSRSEKGHKCDRCLAAWPKVPFNKDRADIFRIEEKAEQLLLSACKVCQMLGMVMQGYQDETPDFNGPFLLRWKRLHDTGGIVIFHGSNGIERGGTGRPGPVHVWQDSIYALTNPENVEGVHCDFGAIKSWLDKCDLHIECKSSVQQGPQNLRVIDCMERAVVSAPLDCQYVALSYVWGGLVFKTDSTSGILPTMLPRTIEDGIKATLLLGYRYLWVDAFCIKQDDAEDKHHQIQQMDLIYTLSVLTLIAAAGSDPSYGLPGVSNARKLRFLNTSIGNVCLSFTPENVHRAVADSPWFIRGWTFQEGYVARRRLYFTESGILFVCNTAEEHEELCRHHGPANSILEGTLNSRALKVKNDGLEGIMRLLKQYMKRQLSYENDVLNAILGVLNYHHTRNPSIGTICGLPYQKSVADPDIICVNWAHERPATRRLGYPSWSPFGWIGPVNFSRIEDQFHPSKEDAASFSCHVRDGCADWNHLKTSQYLQITVHIHCLPIVRITRPNWPSGDSESVYTMLAIPYGDTKLNYDDPNFYTDILWDQAQPGHYDSDWVTCAVFHDHRFASHPLMILQDCGTHYERIGIAMSYGTYSMTTIRAAGLKELYSVASDIPTLYLGDGANSYMVRIRRDVEDFTWLQDGSKVIITLG